jgi:homoserine kinase type II
VAARHELTWAGLHGDPSPEAFFRRPSGDIALIDWGSWMIGPALYDLASAAMYVGTDAHLIPAYQARHPDLPTDALPAFLRFRYAVQAAYFAWRIDTNVQTGATPQNDNQKGLVDARRALTGG